ncbi:MAG TPA: DUF4197 domain-containing protein [Gallionellaceae bacterium]|nr:DUF4197 domain-containing protein [Gallionellaceae bacterium]
MRKIFLILLCVVCSAPAGALSLSQLSNKDAVDGLKAALDKGTVAAVGKLGKVDGFLGNPRVRIPLPQSLQRADHVLSRFGMGNYTQDLEVRMNRAAELAVPEAKSLLLQAIKQMSFKDAKAILTGGNTAATDYFRRTTSQPLAAKFLPIVQRATAKVQLAQKYDEFAGKAARFGLLDKSQANLEQYVTQKALDGLFLMMADEEKAIRRDPVGQASKLISKVFGALRQ